MVNSVVFGRLLKAHCPKLQGGQYRLEGRYVHGIPLPAPDALPGELVDLGRRIHEGRDYDSGLLIAAALAAYGHDERLRSARLERQFQTLADRWYAETAYLSSVTDIVDHAAYQEVIKMGRPALPHILRDLAERKGHWFNALNAIAGTSPVPAGSRASVKQVREAWLEWGRKEGVL